MFTVIIPLYNKASFIAKTIQSVKVQTYRNFEIVIINDGSTDNSLEVINKIDFKNIDYKIISQINSGVSTARNNGVKLAKYDYITFLDADDWWEPNFLEQMVRLIESFPDAGLYACSYFKIKNKIKIPAIINIDSKFIHGYIDYMNLYSKGIWMPIWTGATIVKKEILDNLKGFKPNLKMGEDFDLWLRISQNYKIAYLNIPLSNYNQDVDSENRAIGMKFYKPEEHFLFQDFKTLKENSDFIYLFEKLALYGLFPYYLYNKNFIEVKKILSTIHWSMHPFKWFILYNFIPKYVLRMWLNFKMFVVNFKKTIL